jgi:hypothetical protein
MTYCLLIHYKTRQKKYRLAMAGLAQNSFGLLNFKKIAFKIKEKSDCFSLCDPAGTTFV